jgi:MOSC domain-containing protein YiiM
MQFKQLQDVWKTWFGLRVRGTKWIQKQREKVINADIQSLGARHSGYLNNVPVQHANALKNWIDDGVFKRTQPPTFAENPTLTGVNVDERYAPYSYGIPFSLYWLGLCAGEEIQEFQLPRYDVR